jgi:hypothetical protein
MMQRRSQPVQWFRSTLIWNALFLGCIATAASIGCASRQPGPTVPPARLPATGVPKIERPSAPPIVEEVLPPDTSAPAASAPTGPEAAGAPGPQPEPESLIAMIQPTTPPNVAAATRLVETARAELSTGQTDAAIEKLEQAIAIDPNNAYAYYFLAESHFNHGTYDQAVVFADKAALLSTRMDPSWASRSYCLQGRIYEASGRFADARASYGQAVEADAGNRTASEGLARLGGVPPEQP